MAKKITIKETQEVMSKSSDPRVRAIAPFVPGALRIIKFIMRYWDVAEFFGLPKGTHLKAIILEGDTPQRRGEVACANWLIKTGYKEAKKVVGGKK